MPYVPSIVGTLNGGVFYKDLYTIEPATTFLAGALVFFDPSTQTIKPCATDAVLCLGMALENAAVAIAGNGSGPAGKILVGVFTQETIIRLKGSTDPTVAHILVATGYGITAAATTSIPTLDLTDTTNVLLKVIQVDLVNKEFICVPKGLTVQVNLVVS